MTWRFQVSNLRRSAWLLACLHCVFAFTAFAHPASGIVVDSQGHVYFIYSAHGVMRIETSGVATNIHRDSGGHWLALDSSGSFSRVTPKLFERITPDGSLPALIFATGGAPLVVGEASFRGYVVFGESKSGRLWATNIEQGLKPDRFLRVFGAAQAAH
jgi:hypothetical protein